MIPAELIELILIVHAVLEMKLLINAPLENP